ncbi:positive regulator of sigma E activity [Pedobacter sp. UYEF25]
MQAFDELQELWQKHEVDIKFSAEDMLSQAKKEVNGIRSKSLLNIFGMVFSFLLFFFVWVYYSHEKWTTHVGFAIILIAILVSTTMLVRDYKLIAKNDFTINPSLFLEKLQQYQSSRFKLYNQMYWLYTVALTVGFVLAILELLDQLSDLQKTIALGLSFLWIVFCSTVLRKIVLSAEKERIALLIEKFERIGNQLKES